MSRQVKFTVRPFRAAWTVGLCITAALVFGWGAGLLVGLACVDLEWKQ